MSIYLQVSNTKIWKTFSSCFNIVLMNITFYLLTIIPVLTLCNNLYIYTKLHTIFLHFYTSITLHTLHNNTYNQKVYTSSTHSIRHYVLLLCLLREHRSLVLSGNVHNLATFHQTGSCLRISAYTGAGRKRTIDSFYLLRDHSYYCRIVCSNIFPFNKNGGHTSII